METLILNLAITVYLVAGTGKEETARRHTLYTGDCELVSPLNTGIHLIINALSTILLSSSNYCMQCLSAPTRQDIDKAHRNKRWLDMAHLASVICGVSIGVECFCGGCLVFPLFHFICCRYSYIIEINIVIDTVSQLQLGNILCCRKSSLLADPCHTTFRRASTDFWLQSLTRHTCAIRISNPRISITCHMRHYVFEIFTYKED
jgi:hypothetical protein